MLKSSFYILNYPVFNYQSKSSDQQHFIILDRAETLIVKVRQIFRLFLWMKSLELSLSYWVTFGVLTKSANILVFVLRSSSQLILKLVGLQKIGV